MKKILPKLALLILPLVFFLAGAGFNRAEYSADPEYAYLLNGLNAAGFQSAGHFDHPGSTVQMWNAVVMRVYHLLDFSSNKSLKEEVLSNPDKYISILIFSILLLNTLTMAIAGLITCRKLGSLWPALLIQLTPFLSSNILEQAWTKLSPEPFLLAATYLFIILMVAFFTSEKQQQRSWSLWFAVAAGVGVATKVTFLPLTLIPLFILKTYRNKLLYLIACIPAFVVFTIPAWHAYRLMANWFIGLGTHTGIYGQGSQGIIDPLHYYHNLSGILYNNPSLTITLIAGLIFTLVLLILRKKKSSSGFTPYLIFLIAALLAQIAGILLVAKHYHMNHYLLPVLALNGWIWVLILLSVWKLLPDKPALRLIPALLFLAAFSALSASSIPYLRLADYYYKDTNREYRELEDLLKSTYNTYTRVDYFPYSIDQMNALRWGNVYAMNLYSEDLRKLYPGNYFYDVYSRAFFEWSKPISPASLKAQSREGMILTGGIISPDFMSQMNEAGLYLKQLYSGRTQAIYLIDPSSPVFSDSSGSIALKSFSFSMDTLTSDGKWFLAGTEKAEAGNSQSSETAFSGKFSAKFSANEEYGLLYKLTDVKPGQVYRISIRRKGVESSTFLCASADDSGLFYVQSGETAGRNDGWDLIMTEFSIPDGLAVPYLKIYTWNHSGREVYFDDLSIERIR